MNANLDNHFVSVIVPTINRNSLSIVLEALNKQTRKPDEIIVMEDKNRLGPSIMRNEGIEKSKGDLIAFLDDDNVPPKDWLEIFVKEIDRYDADGVSSNYSEEDQFLDEIRQRRNYPKEVVINPNGFFGLGGNCMYRKVSLEECKRQDAFIFDPKFKITQDTELALRMRSHGFKLVYVINNIRHLKKLNSIEFIIFQFYRGTAISRLYILRNSYKNIGLGPGLLWDDSAKKHPIKKWFFAFWQRILGPFDYKSFSKFNYFILFWAGEKAKAAGFLFSLINSKFNLIKKHFSLGLKIIISVIVLTYLFSIIPFSSILSSILSADIVLLLIGIILSSPISYLSAFETQYLTKIQGMTLSVFEILKIHLATSFYGLFLPGTLSGGAVKWYKFSKHSNKSSAAAVIVLNRFLEILMVVIIGILFSLPILYEAKNQKLLVLLVIIFFIMILLYFALLKKSVLILIENIFHKLPFPFLVKEKTGKFLKAMSQFQNLRLKDHLEIFGLLFLYHGLGVSYLFFFCTFFKCKC